MRHSRLLTYALVVVTGSVSCGDPGGPEPPAVAIDVSMTPMVVVLASDGWPQAVCNFNLHLSAGAKPAKLVAGLWKFFTGPVRGAPTSTYNVNVDDLTYAFGNDTIAARDTVETQWTVNDGYPFEVQFVLRYNAGVGETIVQSDRLACGPAAPSSPATPPVLSGVALNPAGVVAPGDQLRA